MLFRASFVVQLVALQQVFAAPQQPKAAEQPKTPAQAGCTNPRIRKEWRSLTVDERKGFTTAVNCLMNKPSKFKKYYPLVETRYDDFVALHVNETGISGQFGHPQDGQPHPGAAFNPFAHDDVHGGGSILPWHRYAIQSYEDALTEECGLKIGLPYWNWFLDSKDAGGDFVKSPLFDPVSGFGGNGKKEKNAGGFGGFGGFGFGGTGGGCITDGPFVNRTLRIGPQGKMAVNNTRCLRRDFNPNVVDQTANKKVLGPLLNSKTYAQFCQVIGMQLHNVGHMSVGGEMMDPFNSVNDPLFFLHHSNLDQLWALWEEQDPKRRTDYSARQGEVFGPDSVMSLGVYGAPWTAKELMDTQNRDGKGKLCFKYEGIPIEKYS
ncbi:Di-copper centre-containing protein [Microthyrium microscopicum]|uniref:Di-copper centre-containing protein n=1 Tax=Microthyrium microscopicum TaxID=703497 RepID=A0A6A6U210_9PEZI|nr:Di-copper centre-containing protein [Microthyrium microscopicum]